MSAYLSAKEAAAVAGVSERTVRRWLASGQLKAVRRGRAFAISHEALAAISGLDHGQGGHPSDSGQRSGRTADDNGRAADTAELVALIREQQQTILELSGRVGYFQAQLEQARETIRALEAPRDAPLHDERAQESTPGAEAPSEPAARPWWRRMFGL